MARKTPSAPARAEKRPPVPNAASEMMPEAEWEEKQKQAPVDRAIALAARRAAGPDTPAGASGGLPSFSPPPIAEPCASCGVKCCNRFAVPVTGFDLVRILDKLGGQPAEFAELADAQQIEGSPHSRIFLFKDGRLSERLLTLKRHAKTNWCHFSRHSQGCAIWGFHPMVCRTYPFVLGADDRIKYNKNFVCPRPWEKGEYEPDGVRALLERQEEELAEYNKLVRAWNAERARKGDEKGFWTYIVGESRKKDEGGRRDK